MFQQQSRIFISALIVISLAVITAAFVVYPRAVSSEDGKLHPSGTLNPSSAQENPGRPRHRNLSLHPEAFNLSRKLGQRFSATIWKFQSLPAPCKSVVKRSRCRSSAASRNVVSGWKLLWVFRH